MRRQEFTKVLTPEEMQVLEGLQILLGACQDVEG